jgi:hypothetical protein
MPAIQVSGLTKTYGGHATVTGTWVAGRQVFAARYPS